MKVIMQPDNELRLGDILNAALMENQERFHSFEAAVAFAERSGVQYLVEGLRQFGASGGYAKILVGIDNYGTTYEALADLLNAIDRHGELWVYHDSRKYITFHPKLYLFEGQTRAQLIIGSGNLTQGGLYTNTEASLLCSFDLTDDENRASLIEVKNLLHQWRTSQPNLAKLVNPTLLDELKDLGYIKSESEVRIASEVEAETENSFASAPPPDKVLFGKGIHRRSLPTLPRTRHITRTPSVRPSKAASLPAASDIEREIEVDSTREILIRYIPKAGNRTSQVHFTLEIVTEYFHLDPTVTSYIQLQQHVMTPISWTRKR